MKKLLLFLPVIFLLFSCEKFDEVLATEQVQAILQNGNLLFVKADGEILKPAEMPATDSLIAGRLYEISFSKAKDGSCGGDSKSKHHDKKSKHNGEQGIKIHAIKLLPNGIHLGKIKKVSVEGGCWVIELENGKTLSPIFKNGTPFTLADGQQVKFDYQEASNILTICMVGTPVYVTSIELINGNSTR